MAGEALAGECIIVFADTLFTMEQAPDLDADAVVWVKEVEDPSRFGVVVKDGDRITDFVEKPETPISNEAIVGIYYVRDGAVLAREIQYLMDHNVTGKGDEYQLTDALDRMLKAGQVFKTARVDEWLDCGTIPALKETTAIMLGKEGREPSASQIEGTTTIHAPVWIGEGAVLRDSVVGPNVVIEAGATLDGSTVRDTTVFAGATVQGSTLHDSFVGHSAEVTAFTGTLNIGDHATVG